MKARGAIELADDEAARLIGTCELHDWRGETRSCVATATSEAALSGCTTDGISRVDHLAQSLAAMTRFTDQMCQCSDAKCAERISDEMSKWAAEEAKHDTSPPKLTEAETKQFTALGERLGKCMSTAMTVGVDQASPEQVAPIEDR